MSSIYRMALLFIATVCTLVLFSPDAEAQRRGRGVNLSGDMSLGLGVSTVSASQDGLNGAIDDAISQGANIKALGSAWEFYANWGYRISMTPYSFILRPSYFMQTADGNGPSGSYKYDLSGFTVFPIMRITPLENSFIKFYMQAGIGYGSLSGKISAASTNVDFKGSALGAMGGIGVDFCFTESHCLNVEGNLRYLPIERNVVSSGNCSSGSAIPGITQCGNGQELERNNADLSTTMSGVQGLVGYTMNF